MTISWTEVSARPGNWLDVAVSDTGRFVAVYNYYYGSTDQVMYSNDGLAWTSVSLPYPLYNGDWRAITWANGLFVAVGSSYGRDNIMTSPDGVSWTLRHPIDQFSFKDVTTDGSSFIAVSDTRNYVARSVDGITWITILGPDGGGAPLPVGISTYVYVVDYCNGKFVAACVTGTERIMYSFDGLSWFAASAALSPMQIKAFAGKPGGGIVAVAETGNAGFFAAYSTNGLSWTAIATPRDNAWNDVKWSADLGLFIAVSINDIGGGGTTEKCMTSPDGLIWTLNTTFYPNYSGYSGIVCGPSNIVAVGYHNYGWWETVMIASSLAPPQVINMNSNSILTSETWGNASKVTAQYIPPRHRTGYLGKILQCCAIELEFLGEQVANLINESTPGTVDQLLPEWEEELGLPDLCSPLTLTKDERLRAVYAKYITLYTGQNKQFYINYVSNLGGLITITDYTGAGAVFRVNYNRVTRTPLEGIDGARLRSKESRFKWIVNVYSTGSVSLSYIQCRFNQMKPAHTQIIWNDLT